MKTLNRIICFVLVGILLLFSLPVSAEDTIPGKSLFVSLSGDDSYTREQNDIDHPWATPKKAWENAQAGDTVYFRGGTYYVTSTISTYRTGYNGTAENPITFRSYPGETATIDGGTLAKVFVIEKNWNIIKDLNFTGGHTVIQFGFDVSINGGIVENCTAQDYLGGDCVGFVYVDWGGSNITIRDCRISGPGDTSSCIIAFNAPGLKVLHNELYNAHMGVHYKHGQRMTSNTGVEIAYNYIYDTENPMELNTGYAYIHDNLMIGESSSNEVLINMANGGPNGDHNLITHNTFYNTFLHLDSGDGADNGALYNTMKDNIFMGIGKDIAIFPYSADENYKTNVFDYNLYLNGSGSCCFRRNRTSYTLADWEKLTGQSDDTSISGTPVFANNSGTMTKIADFYLASNSPGKNVASDRKDMGADISLVIDPTGTSTDKLALNAAITAAQGLNSADYTQESWSNLETALGNALAVQADGRATQEEVDAATTALATATSGLVPVISGISLDSAQYALRTAGVRQTRQIVVTASSSGSGTLSLTQGVSYTSGDESIATVNNQGIITAVDEGWTDIYAEYAGYQAQARVFVLPPEPDGTNEAVKNESAFSQEDYLFTDDFEIDRLSSYYSYYNTLGRFKRATADGVYGGGIGNTYGMRSLYGFYEFDKSIHSEPYGTWLNLAVGKTPDNVTYKPAGDPGTAERELYWRFYVKNYTQAQSGTLGSSPIAQVYGYGTDSAGTRIPFMSVNVYYPNDESGILMSELKTGVFGGDGKPTGTTDGPAIPGTMPVMQREFANQWHMVQIHVKLNDAGQSNGQYHLWVDGQLQASAEALDWAGNYTEYGINECVIYNTNQWPGVPGGDTEYRMFDNMVISRTKIGEAGAISSNNADLLSIRSSIGKRIPDIFDAAVTEYAIEVEHGTNNLQLTAETSHPDSTIKVGETSYDSGEAIPVVLEDGTATVSIEVTAPNGVTKKTYIVNVVTRKAYLVKEAENPKADWIFWDDFEKDRMSLYSDRTNDKQFYRSAGIGLGGSTGMKALFRAADGKGYETGSIRIALGRNPVDWMKPVGALGEDLKEIYVRFYVKNEKGWKGGGGAKMARISSFQSQNMAQSMIAHLWSGGTNDNYLTIDPASGTDIDGVLKSTKWNDFDNLRWLGQKKASFPMFDEEHVGEWYAVETHVKLNDPGQSNGIFELWIDDKLQASSTDLNWIGSFEMGPGKGYGINWCGLENYWNAGSPQDQERYFDNFVVSRSKIGLAEIDSTTVDPVSVTINEKSFTMKAGDTRTLTATVLPDNASNKILEWESSNTSVATVDANGKVTAVSDGTATITTRVVDTEITDTSTVTVSSKAVTITGPSVVDGLAPFEVTYGLKGVQDIRAQKVVVSYDRERFDFVSAEPVKAGVMVLKTVPNTDAGTVTLIMASPGDGNAISGDAGILELVFSPKTAGTGTISIDAVLADSSGNEFTMAVTGISIEVLGKAELISAINTALGIYNNAQEGILSGQYPAGTKDRLNTAIVAAISVRDTVNATGTQITQAIANLNAAVARFQSLLITAATGDINNTPGIGVGDLAIIANNYGKKSGDSGWDSQWDLNGDGEIGLYELAFIARRMI